MRSKILCSVTLIFSALLVACSSQPPAPVVGAQQVNPLVVQPRVTARPSLYFPSLGAKTVQDVLQMYGKNADDKLGFYFKKANVPYPPRDIILIAFKQEKKMELWARDNGEFRFIRDYYILAASGDPGPKLQQGDRQVPEGIYRITELNPNSHFHLSMKLNYPNEFDLIHAEEDGRSHLGSDIFIHGKHASIGCLAMGDAAIRELFVLVAEVGLQNVKVIIAPHNPRTYPLAANLDEMPEWTPQLYDWITREIENVMVK